MKSPSRVLERMTELHPDAPVTLPAVVARLLLLSHLWGLTKRQREQLDRLLAKLEVEDA